MPAARWKPLAIATLAAAVWSAGEASGQVPPPLPQPPNGITPQNAALAAMAPSAPEMTPTEPLPPGPAEIIVPFSDEPYELDIPESIGRLKEGSPYVRPRAMADAVVFTPPAEQG